MGEITDIEFEVQFKVDWIQRGWQLLFESELFVHHLREIGYFDPPYEEPPDA